jgi:dihydrofolate reductase
MNTLPKYVVSTTLEKVEWTNSHLIRGNIVEEVSALKQQAGQDILIGGSATLVRTLMQQGLIDAYRLLVYPIVLGKGKRLFSEGHRMPLRLVDTQTFRSGVVALTYQPADRGGTA